MSGELLLAKIETPEQQLQVIRRTTSLPAYHDFYRDHFLGIDEKTGYIFDQGLKDIAIEQGDREGNEFDHEYFRFLTFVGYFCAQHAVDLLEGYSQIQYLRSKSRRLVTGPLHLWSLASTMAFANLKVDVYREPIRKEVVRRAQIEGRNPQDDPAYHGLEGVFTRIAKGEVVPFYENRLMDKKIELAKNRAAEPRKIALLTPELNQKVAGMYLKPEEADNMPKVTFEREMYPKLDGLQAYFDPRKVFLTDPRLIRDKIYAR